MSFQSIGKYVDDQLAKVRPLTAAGLKRTSEVLSKVATKVEPKKAE